MKQIQLAKSWEELENPVQFQSLGLKSAKALDKITQLDLKCEISVQQHEYIIRTNKLINGRQMLWMLCNHLRLSDDDNLYEMVHLQALEIYGDNLDNLKTEWQKILLCLRHLPNPHELESALRRRLEQSPQF